MGLIKSPGMTIQQQIAYGNALNISNAKMNLHKVLAVDNNKLVINYQSIFTRYRYYFEQHIIQLRLSEEEYMAYRFRPKTLSKVLYGTIEFAPLLLMINNIISVAEFDFKVLNVFDAAIKTFVSEVQIKEGDRIKKNRVEIDKETM